MTTIILGKKNDYSATVVQHKVLVKVGRDFIGVCDALYSASL
jgi:hypothetical protein